MEKLDTEVFSMMLATVLTFIPTSDPDYDITFLINLLKKILNIHAPLRKLIRMKKVIKTKP